MTCDSFMVPAPESIRPDATLGQGALILADKGYRTLPIAADDGTYHGALTRRHVWHIVLPTAATIDRGIRDLSFVRGQLPVLRERLRAARDMPVLEVLEQFPIAVPTVARKTSMSEAARLLYEHGFGIPVLEEGLLVGLITGHSAIRAIVGESA